MKTLFIEAKYNKEIKIDSKIINKLPDKIGLITTVQFVDQISSIKKQLIKNYKQVFTAKSQPYEAQILGCDVDAALKIKNKVDAFLYIGTGEFHPVDVAIKTNKPVYIYNPIDNILDQIKSQEIETYKKQRKGALIKFLSADNIGILVSTKPGQNNLNKALELKNKLKKQNKNAYIFISDDIDLNQLENFPFIQSWVNTACPRIIDDKHDIMNIEELRNR